MPMKTLVIAEKPSVAQDLARALGMKPGRGDDFYENDEYVVSSAVGHLLELTVPEEHDIKKGKWSLEKLPHLPPEFALAPIDRTASRLAVLKRLLKRKDVTEVINACDAGREGELIFRNIMRAANARQPLKRLWLQSMTTDAIRTAFTKLRSDADMMPLADAATSRSEADWLVGINSTRALTAFNSRGGGFLKTTAGRVVHSEQSISRMEALKMHTIWAAWMQNADSVKGSLEPGKLADLVVIDRDILTVPEDQIRDIQPVLTMVENRIVYERK